MANVAHSSLTGAELHEPKGASTALAGTVYVANGSGSGSWSDVGTASFTGMIADFVSPVPPSGWLELDGSIISTSTYAGLYGVMSLQTSGTRNNGTAIITSIPSTANFRVGYYVFGTGISSGTTILSIDSATQITMSGNALSSGSSSFAVSPWLLNTGTITLPNLTSAGRFRRSRTSSTKVGDVQTDQNKAHTHSLSVSGTTSSNGDHFHTAAISDSGHSHAIGGGNQIGTGSNGIQGGGTFVGPTSPAALTITSATTGVRVNSSNGLDTVNNAGAHTHTVTSTGTSGSDGGTEVRPVAIVVLTCVKT